MDIKEIEERFKENLSAFAENGYSFGNGHKLREKNEQGVSTQREAFDAYSAGLRAWHRQGYHEIPTGVGKTASFIALIKCYLDAASNEPDVPGPRVLIAVPTERVAIHIARSLAKFLPNIAPTIETDDATGKEIDWKNSSIGLQYKKVKHAHRKPKILITTYHSLIRDETNVIYPPNEYGFVIYDEGHVLTAPEFGKAVDKFKDSIQLAVTATPEYTEEKAVSTLLPYCYYTLPLKEAINRGDLCNVRSVLLKTHYEIDEEKFQEFMRIQGGNPLSKKQLETLLNQETRNRAALEAYFLKSDPDSGERYLGQNGTAYCGGTAHVDDFVRLSHRMLNDKKFLPIREWLDTEEVELIAPVHSKIKGAYLRPGMLTNRKGIALIENRKYEGNKEHYSEEEIFDLHAQGKILLLASSDKLKVGYDCPRDSFLVDLVDRFSKLEATQIYGRPFRNDDDNPDKLATLMNLVDENTHRLYRNNPQMLPIYGAEVIDGADFRESKRRPHALKRFKSSPPDIYHTLEESGFELITDINRVRAVSAEYKRIRDSAKVPLAPDNWKSSGTLVNEYVGDAQKFIALLEELRVAKLAEGMPADVVHNEWVGQYSNKHSAVVWFASPQAIAELKLLPRADQAPTVPENWQSGTMLVSEYVGAAAKFNALLEELRDAKLAEGMPADVVHNKWVGRYSNKFGLETWFGSPQAIVELKLLSRAEQAPRARKNWKNGNMLVKEYVGDARKINSLLEKMRDTKLAEGMPADVVHNEWVGWYSNKQGAVAWFASPQAIAELKLLPRADHALTVPENWQSGLALSNKFVGRDQKFIALLEELRNAKLAENMPADVVHNEWVGWYSNKTGTETWFGSPQAIAQLAEQGQLKPKGQTHEESWVDEMQSRKNKGSQETGR